MKILQKISRSGVYILWMFPRAIVVEHVSKLNPHCCAGASVGRPTIKGSGSLVSGYLMKDLMQNLTMESDDTLGYTFDPVTDVQGAAAECIPHCSSCFKHSLQD